METISKSYFIDLISIPNLDTQFANIDTEMLKYSTELLKKVLGYDLWKKLIAANPSDNTTDYGKLYYGTEYTVDDIVYKWNGFVNSDKISPLADYTFIQYNEGQWVVNGSHGTTIPTPELSELNGSANRMVKVWQRMEKQIQSLYDYMYRSELYQDLVGDGYAPYKFENRNSFGV